MQQPMRKVKAAPAAPAGVRPCGPVARKKEEKKRWLPTCFQMPLVSPLLLVLYSQLMSSVDSPLAAAYSYTA